MAGNGLDDLFLSEKVRELETRHIKLESLIEHLAESMDEIKISIREALDLKGRVDANTNQLKVMWDRIDDCKEDIIRLDKKVESINQAQSACQERQKEERQWRAQRAGSLADKAIWAAVIVICVGTVLIALAGYLK